MTYSNNSQRLRTPKPPDTSAMTYHLTADICFPVHAKGPEGFKPYTSTYGRTNERLPLQRAVADAHAAGIPFALVGSATRIAIWRQQIRTERDLQRTARRTESTIHTPNWTRHT